MVLCAVAASQALSHPAPSSSLRLEVQGSAVRAEYWLPVSELGLARAQDSRSDLPAYLLRRMSAESAAGMPWHIAVDGVREDTYLDHAFLVAALTFTPPHGQAMHGFVLTDDVITHEVRNHVLFVVKRVAGGMQLLGALQYPARRLEILLTE